MENWVSFELIEEWLNDSAGAAFWIPLNCDV